MKNKEEQYKELSQELGIEDEDEQKKVLRRANVAIMIILFALIIIVSFVVYFCELKFGKSAGTIALIVLAILIAGYLYKDELIAKFKRKK